MYAVSVGRGEGARGMPYRRRQQPPASHAAPPPLSILQVVSVIVAHDLRAGEFVAQVPFFPPLQSPADFPPPRIAELLAAAAGPLAGARQGPGSGSSNGAVKSSGGSPTDIRSDPGFEICEARPWRMSAQVAAAFEAARGRVVLAGDAAHRFPPAGGFGMNTGIQVCFEMGRGGGEAGSPLPAGLA